MHLSRQCPRGNRPCTAPKAPPRTPAPSPLTPNREQLHRLAAVLARGHGFAHPRHDRLREARRSVLAPPPVYLDPDRLPPEVLRRPQHRPRPHERIENEVARIREVRDPAAHQRNRLLRRVRTAPRPRELPHRTIAARVPPR